MTNGVSVVVCCHNSEQMITPTLQCLFDQKFRLPIKWELIVVDNNSSDKTVQKVEHCIIQSSPTLHITIVEEKKQGLIRARRKGISCANFDLLLFVDDDNHLAPGYVEMAYQVFTDNPLVAACSGTSNELLPNEFEAPYWWENYKHVYAIGSQGAAEGVLPEKQILRWGAGLGIRKEIFTIVDQIGIEHSLVGRNANASTSGEDIEILLWIALLGYQQFYSSALVLKHAIAPKRITEESLLGMVKNNAEAGSTLSIYRRALNGRFWSHTTITFFQLCRFVLRFLAYSTTGQLMRTQRAQLVQKIKLLNAREALITTWKLGPGHHNKILATAKLLLSHSIQRDPKDR